MALNEDSSQFTLLDDQENPIPKEAHAPFPRWLLVLYTITLCWAFVWLFLFWNGSTVPQFDEGGWRGLQQAANTTYPWKTEPGLRKGNGAP